MAVKGRSVVVDGWVLTLANGLVADVNFKKKEITVGKKKSKEERTKIPTLAAWDRYMELYTILNKTGWWTPHHSTIEYKAPKRKSERTEAHHSLHEFIEMQMRAEFWSDVHIEWFNPRNPDRTEFVNTVIESHGYRTIAPYAKTYDNLLRLARLICSFHQARRAFENANTKATDEVFYREYS